MPDVETLIRQSISSAVLPAFCKHLAAASAASAEACCRYNLFFFAPAGPRVVPVKRYAGIAGFDAGIVKFSHQTLDMGWRFRGSIFELLARPSFDVGLLETVRGDRRGDSMNIGMELHW